MRSAASSASSGSPPYTIYKGASERWICCASCSVVMRTSMPGRAKCALPRVFRARVQARNFQAAHHLLDRVALHVAVEQRFLLLFAEHVGVAVNQVAFQ